MFDYELDYIYVFCNELDFDSLVRLQDLKEKDCAIVGFKEKQNVFVISLMANDLKFKYSHQFKRKDKKIVYQTEIENGNFNMHVDIKDIIENCEYISLIGGLESDLDI